MIVDRPSTLYKRGGYNVSARNVTSRQCHTIVYRQSISYNRRSNIGNTTCLQATVHPASIIWLSTDHRLFVNVEGTTCLHATVHHAANIWLSTDYRHYTNVEGTTSYWLVTLNEPCPCTCSWFQTCNSMTGICIKRIFVCYNEKWHERLKSRLVRLCKEIVR